MTIWCHVNKANGDKIVCITLKCTDVQLIISILRNTYGEWNFIRYIEVSRIEILKYLSILVLAYSKTFVIKKYLLLRHVLCSLIKVSLCVRACEKYDVYNIISIIKMRWSMRGVVEFVTMLSRFQSIAVLFHHHSAFNWKRSSEALLYNYIYLRCHVGHIRLSRSGS